MGTGQNKRKIERWREKEEDVCWGCGEKIAYRNMKVRHISIVLFVTQGDNVTLDGGEAEAGERWQSTREVEWERGREMYN